MYSLSKLLKKQVKVALGRWNIDYCPNKIAIKVLNANEDHCGSCRSTPIPLELKKENNFIDLHSSNNISSNKKIIVPLYRRE